jgi:hypothetical protein
MSEHPVRMTRNAFIALPPGSAAATNAANRKAAKMCNGPHPPPRSGGGGLRTIKHGASWRYEKYRRARSMSGTDETANAVVQAAPEMC